MLKTLAVSSFLALPFTAGAQEATIIYRLGHDTVAIEQFNRTPTRLAGEMISRQGPTIARITYDIAMTNGRPTRAVLRRLQPDGSPAPNAPLEYRFTFGRDTAKREIVWRDSTQTQTFAAANAFFVPPTYVYGPYELIYARGAARDSVPAINPTGSTVAMIGLQAYSGDTLRMRAAPYAILARFDHNGRLMMTDGVFTTNKAIGTRQSGKIDLTSLARTMKPTGVLSPRATAYAGFNRGPIFINYGRPAVRDRTVWGGVLIPFDTIWRTGANEATHLATSKTIALGDMTLAPGLYTLWTRHTHGGTWLIVNKQVGQWGTEYDPKQDIGRIRMEMAKTTEHVEDFTITIRPTGPNRGAFDFAWGDSVATASFIVK